MNLFLLCKLATSGVLGASAGCLSSNFLLCQQVDCYLASAALHEQLLLHHYSGGEAVLQAREQLLLHHYPGGSEAVHLSSSQFQFQFVLLEQLLLHPTGGGRAVLFACEQLLLHHDGGEEAVLLMRGAFRVQHFSHPPCGRFVALKSGYFGLHQSFQSFQFQVRIFVSQFG